MCMAPDTPLTGRDPQQATAALKGVGPERLVDLGIRLGPWGDDLGQRPGGLTLDEVRRHPNGLRLAELEGGRLDEVLVHAFRAQWNWCISGSSTTCHGYASG